MKRKSLFLLGILCFFSVIYSFNDAFCAEKIKLKLFYSLNCKYCVDIKEEFLPGIISKYKDKIEIDYLDLADQKNYKLFLAAEKEFNIKARIPSILVGNNFLAGSDSIKNNLDSILEEYSLEESAPSIKIGSINLLERFHSFSPLAIIAAGLIDGINPCAFTVLIFFISFLTLMGYRRKDLVIIGGIFILAVFLTYLAIGLGIFKGLYELKHFYTLLQGTYFGLALLCFIMAYFNLRDFYVYRRTKTTDSLKVKLPKPVRSRINAIISKYYRKDTSSQPRNLLGMIVSTFIVGFLISLLEAICTGQVYLPTIVFILKEPSLRVKAWFFLLLYNFMFVVPLLLILLFVVLGSSSKKIEEFFRKRLGLVKILMFILFLGLGIFLLIGV